MGAQEARLWFSGGGTGYHAAVGEACEELAVPWCGFALETADALLHPYLGSDEFISRHVRYILALQDASPALLRTIPNVVDRMNRVSRFRRGEIP